MNHFIKMYHKLSNFGKILLFITIFLIIIVLFKRFHLIKKSKEGFVQNQEFLFKKGPEIYDDFYASVYDYLVFNPVKNDYEIGMILNKNVPNVKSVVLDVGSGTGHHASKLADNGIDVIGIDISPSMIQQAKNNYPHLNFKQGDVLNSHEFINNSFTHILCFYFTIYYLENKQQFFNNSFSR
jgi:SAM-dependent methyltransferase